MNGRILLEKVHEFAKAFNYNDFTASHGWLLKRMLFLMLYNTLHREETELWTEIIWTPMIRKLINSNKFCIPLRIRIIWVQLYSLRKKVLTGSQNRSSFEYISDFIKPFQYHCMWAMWGVIQNTEAYSEPCQAFFKNR